ncbi:MAG: YqhA family protein [Anaerolineae bacterium]|jgi:uncharacterized membrane protein YqhA|nr:YqhA family protein [Anaerolineae bacterium]
MRAIERLFEIILWNSRMVIIVPVMISLLLCFGVFATTTVDAFMLLGRMIQYITTPETRSMVSTENIGLLVAIIDGYLLAAILFIFALGMYELFVNKVDIAEGSEFASRVLLIKSLDDLKDRLANVILLILIVKFFQQALKIKYENTTDLILLALAVVMIAGALYLSGRARPAYKYLGPEAKDQG